MTATDVLDLFDRAQRQATWRFDLTDRFGTVLGELPVDRDAPPTVSVDTGRAAKRTMQNVNLPVGVIHDVDVISDRVRLWMITEGGSESPQGWFLFTSSTHEPLSTPLLTAHDSHLGHLNMVDLTLVVDQPTPKSFTARPSTTITTFMLSVLAGLPIVVNIVPSAARVQGAEALTWPAGTNRLRIFNECADMIGYHELYFDNNGIGQCGPMPDPLTMDLTDVLDYDNVPRIYRPSLVFSDDLLDLPNQFIVLGSGASGAAVVGVYNVPASAPHSAVNRGYVVAHSEQMQGIETNVEARSAAVALSRKYRFAVETVDFTGPPDPRHDHYNAVQIEGQRFLEVGHSMVLREGAPHRHTVRKTYEDTSE